MVDADLRGLSRRAAWAGGETLISRLLADALARPDLVSLAAGFVDQHTLPDRATQSALADLWADVARSQAALQYGTTIGHRPLRESILQRMQESDGLKSGKRSPSIEQIVVTAGSNQLLHLVADTLLDPGDIVLCAAPSYFVFMATLANVGGRSIGVEIDDQGIIPEALEAELSRRDAAGELELVKAIYVTTYYDNPTGINTTVERRCQLIEIARRWSKSNTIYLIEDAAYRELRYYGDETPSLYSLDDENDCVIHAGTFSKSYSPGIRVGWGVLPKRLVRPVLAQKGNVDFGSPHFSQALMTSVVEKGLFARHVECLKAGYRRKLDATLAASEKFLKPLGIDWVRPTGGLYLWLRLPEHIDASLEGALFRRAVDEGVLYVPGDCCYPLEGAAIPKNRIRLSFGVPTVDVITRGIESLGRAIAAIAR